MKMIFMMERQCWVQKRILFFSRIFEFYRQFIISGDNESREETDPKKEREREREKGSWEKRLKGRCKQKPKKGWPPSPVNLQDPLSTVARAGSQMSVLTYAPMSSLSPFPGPDLWWRISMASLILRLYARRRLFLSCMFVMTVKLALSNLCWQCW